ncbi:poly-gamma-glutamate synthesis protein (capsule biosynthesis protein) [Streptosporangium becharense]|uniref:Poly-gamma-glutamate synthesis protein (Capsule biosynthesis protein) n=1 Tax=Streptosporangium becharense TaxID=1816182 RepID=A0A7W9IAH2_9ACTN|nr:CapA family protein [Streptosporangium becharense]MBB2914057.1 poly-gamma-glutamate synthesis protein (capsule biosynthesis protein) [Streptosporangium becharense]MBB5817084.1 poly-gamma-glutamate synthesis protein (capsule biosynthesis protein) [Streptosporangium becharense]
MGSDILVLGAVGDLILDAPGPDAYFEPSLEVLRSFDVLIGHVETPYTLRGHEESTDVAAPACPPDRLDALGRAGFTIGTLAGNHIADRGAPGVADTLAALHRLGIATAGAGPDLAAARRPAVVERGGLRVGVLSYNCVGPDGAKATSGKAGAAYVDVHTVYGKPFGGPGGMPMEISTFLDRRSLAAFQDDVQALRGDVDVLIVALHKGVLHVPVEIAQYEVDLARAAVDAGADAVLGHHAHILKGVQIHAGKPVFHGLGNFVTVTSALSPSPDNSPERRAWAARRRRLAGFDPDPAMPRYPFHPESRNTGIAILRVGSHGVTAGFLPCWIDDDARPVPVTGDRGEAVVRYLERISREAGFAVRMDWDGRTAAVHPITA